MPWDIFLKYYLVSLVQGSPLGWKRLTRLIDWSTPRCLVVRYRELNQRLKIRRRKNNVQTWRRFIVKCQDEMVNLSLWSHTLNLLVWWSLNDQVACNKKKILRKTPTYSKVRWKAQVKRVSGSILNIVTNWARWCM